MIIIVYYYHYVSIKCVLDRPKSLQLLVRLLANMGRRCFVQWHIRNAIQLAQPSGAQGKTKQIRKKSAGINSSG